MKRLALLAVLAVLAIVAAPALSLAPYQPEPLRFAAALPDAGAGTSAPIAAPKRFNMVGLTWRGGGEPAIAVRTRRAGGDWSRWATLPTQGEDGPDPGQEGGRRGVSAPQRGVSAPLWVGSADEVQYRADRPLHGVRLEFLNTRGDATRADRARNGLRRLANSAVLSLAGIARTPAAHAADGQPAMVTRAQWGADKCKPRAAPELGQVRAALVHHTVTTVPYTRAEAPDVVLGICLFHRNTNKWNDIGYNFLVDHYGTIYEGRAGGVDRPIVGAQAEGFNSSTTGIANIGDFSAAQQTPEGLAAVARIIRWKLPLSGAPTSGSTKVTRIGGNGATLTIPRISGHRDVNSTECPGQLLYDQLPELRRLVGSLAATGTTTTVRARTTARGGVVIYGKQARVSGTVTVAGLAAKGRSVAIEARIGSRWRRVATARTDSRGRFSALIKPSRTRSLRVRFAGQGSLLPAVSPVFTIAMRPVLKLTSTPRATAVGARVAMAGTVTPRLPRVYRVLQQRRGRRWVTVGVKPAAVDKRGRVRSTFRPPARGSYRYYLEVRRSGESALARSRKAALRATGGRGGGAGAP